jgi:hypothetical protein
VIGDSTAASAGVIVTVTGIDTGTVFITGVNTGSGYCGMDSTTDTITVQPLAPNPGPITGPGQVCTGLANTFTLIDSGASGLSRIGWSTTTPTIVRFVSPASGRDSVQVLPLQGGVAKFFITDSNNCGTRDTFISVNISGYPNLQSSHSATVCDSVKFTYTPTSDSTDATFTWSRNAVPNISNLPATGIGSIGEYLNDTSYAAVIDTYTYITAVNGCNDTANLVVTVNPTPYLLSPLFDTVCSGSLFHYVDTESTGPTTIANWSRPASGTGVLNVSNAANSGSHNINEVLIDPIQSPGTTYYRYLMNALGCIDSAFVQIEVGPRPVAPSITQHSLATECSLTQYMNFGASTAPVFPTSYSWYGTNGAAVWATGNTRQYCLVNFTIPGDSYVYLEANLDGFNCPAKDSFNVNISNSESDFPTVIYFNGDFICESNTETSYQWGKDDAGTLDSTAFPYQTNQNYTNLNPDFTHNYYWVITSHNTCIQKTYYIVPTGVTNVTSTMGEMTIYPNPASQTVNVEISNTSGGKYKVDLLNMLGQRVDQQELTGAKTAFNIGELAAGVYFIDCYRDGVKFATAKFVKN